MDEDPIHILNETLKRWNMSSRDILQAREDHPLTSSLSSLNLRGGRGLSMARPVVSDQAASGDAKYGGTSRRARLYQLPSTYLLVGFEALLHVLPLSHQHMVEIRLVNQHPSTVFYLQLNHLHDTLCRESGPRLLAAELVQFQAAQPGEAFEGLKDRRPGAGCARVFFSAEVAAEQANGLECLGVEAQKYSIGIQRKRRAF